MVEAVQRLSGASKGESVTSGLVWSEVAAHVRTRSEKQCRCKWLNHLNWRQCGGTEWNRADSARLIEKCATVTINLSFFCRGKF